MRQVHRRLRAVKESFLLDPSVVYLNHGSFGACPRPVFEAYQRWQRELERQPVEFLALERGFPALLDEARRALAAYVGADPENLAFAPNATLGAERGRPLARARARRRGAPRRRRVRRHGAAVGVRPSAHRRDDRASAVRRPRTRAAHARRLLLAHRVVDRARQRPRRARRRDARGGHAARSSTARTHRARSTSTSRRSARTSTRATATSGCARRRARASSTRGPRRRS